MSWIDDILEFMDLPEEWEIFRNENEIMVKYEDAYDITEITLERYANQYGVKRYSGVITIAKTDNEVSFSDACVQHGLIDSEDFDVDVFNERVKEEHYQWEKSPIISSIHAGAEFTIKPTIVERHCLVQIPHYHYYKGLVLEFDTHSIDTVKAILQLYDLIVEFYKWIVPTCIVRSLQDGG